MANVPRQTVPGSGALFRAASIGEMHLTFKQGIKARLLGGPLNFLLARKRPTCGAQTLPVRPSSSVLLAYGEHSAARSIRLRRMDLRVSSQGV